MDVVAQATLRTNALAVIHGAALQAAGLALLPDWMVADSVSAGRLRIILREWSTVPVTAYALHRAELRGAARVRTFIEAVRRGLSAARGATRPPS